MAGNDRNASSPLAVSIGEPAGIGPEVILKAWLSRRGENLPPFAVLGGAGHLEALAGSLELDIPVRQVLPEIVIETFDDALPVVPLFEEAPILARPGFANRKDAALICRSIVDGVDGCLKGIFGGLVTAPINKKALYDAGFDFPGHTEFLADLAANATGDKMRPVMLLAGPELKTVPVTIHIPLSEVPSALTRDLLLETARITARDLKRRFGICAPRLAMSGLNPHAGENGTMGSEDEAVIAPAIRQLQDEGINAFGPLPADTMFHARARSGYDVALCMYHDQALIPAKTLAFDEAVNVTLGLPFIRTSPDHGTAYNIAGTGAADPSSMIAAVRLAGEMAAHSATSPALGDDG